MVVLDASSLLAFLQDEPGAKTVWSALDGALISTVNWSEVVQKSLRTGASISGMREDFIASGATFVAFSENQAEIAAGLWEKTRPFALSLADRACLALALERELPVLSADRVWAELDLGLDVRLIR